MIDVLKLLTCHLPNPACTSGLTFLILPYFTLPSGHSVLRTYQFGPMHSPNVTGLCLRNMLYSTQMTILCLQFNCRNFQIQGQHLEMQLVHSYTCIM